MHKLFIQMQYCWWQREEGEEYFLFKLNFILFHIKQVFLLYVVNSYDFSVEFCSKTGNLLFLERTVDSAFSSVLLVVWGLRDTTRPPRENTENYCYSVWLRVFLFLYYFSMKERRMSWRRSEKGKAFAFRTSTAAALGEKTLHIHTQHQFVQK